MHFLFSKKIKKKKLEKEFIYLLLKVLFQLFLYLLISLTIIIEEGPFLAAAWSSIHRQKGNLTKEPMSYFNAFSRAFGRAYPKGIIIQFHGFENDKGDPQKLSTDLIYSSTLSSPPPRFFTYGKCLKQLPIQLLFYPQEIDILGGTKNINAEKHREVTKEGLFLHLEMSLNLRKRLLKDRSLRTDFINCFIQNEN
jgi:hypothetical protein